jgi:tetratricopeptide (TPR) repeat protein
LLEQGIYSEETKGDIDAAMQLYQQVIADNKASQTLAAQAQYRLGVCLYKKKNFAEATAAFEKLVKDYPDQKELVQLANHYLAGTISLLPAPWVDGEDLRLDIKFPTGLKIGVASYTVNAGELNGKKIWRLGSHLFAGAQQFSRTEVEADSFKPIHSRWKHDLIGDADAVYTSSKIELKLKGKDEPKSLDLDGVVYDNEQVIQLMRRLPLADNYSTSMKVFASLGGGAFIPLKLDVTGPEKVTVPAGTYDCYKVELSIKQTFWYSADDHRYLVKFEAGGVVAELTGVHQRRKGELVKYEDPAFKFSFAAPSDWLVDRMEKPENENKVAFLVLDPDGLSVNRINAQSIDSFKFDTKKTLREWAEADIAEGAKSVKDFEIRPESWQETKVGGVPAVSVICNYSDGKEKSVTYRTYLFANGNSYKFFTTGGRNQFEEQRPKLDAILHSLKTD